MTLRSVFDTVRRGTPAARRDAAERRAAELSQAAREYRDLIQQPGWKRLMEAIEGDIADGVEAYLLAPAAPSRLNPMASIELHERQRAEWCAEARGMRQVLRMPQTIVTDAIDRGLLHEDTGG